MTDDSSNNIDSAPKPESNGSDPEVDGREEYNIMKDAQSVVKNTADKPLIPYEDDEEITQGVNASANPILNDNVNGDVHSQADAVVEKQLSKHTLEETLSDAATGGTLVKGNELFGVIDDENLSKGILVAGDKQFDLTSQQGIDEARKYIHELTEDEDLENHNYATTLERQVVSYLTADELGVLKNTEEVIKPEIKDATFQGNAYRLDDPSDEAALVNAIVASYKKDDMSGNPAESFLNQTIQNPAQRQRITDAVRRLLEDEQPTTEVTEEQKPEINNESEIEFGSDDYYFNDIMQAYRSHPNDQPGDPAGGLLNQISDLEQRQRVYQRVMDQIADDLENK